MSWGQCSSTDAVVETSWSTTKVKSHDLVHCWIIEDFDLHEAYGEEVKSTTFSSSITENKCNCSMVLKPNGELDATDKENASIELKFKLTKGLQSVFIKVSIRCLIEEKEVWLGALGARKFDNVIFNLRWPNAIPKKRTVSRNKLAISCRIVFFHMNEVSNLSSQKIEIPKCNLAEDLAPLAENPVFSDFVISVKGKDFAVHKCILSSRSAVFAAMFKYDTKENQLNRVNIEDVDENVIEEMLRYIYTGKCENLDSLAEELLSAADKYALDRLKIICSSKLVEILSVENAAKILLLSEMHHINELKAEVIKFIANKPKEVFASDGWKNMSNPELIKEVCKAITL